MANSIQGASISPEGLPVTPAIFGYDTGSDRPLDSILVLARNLNPDDSLTQTLKLRTIVASHLIACGAVKKVCCFSGGRDWRDEMTDTFRRPGGQAMLMYSDELAGQYEQAGQPLPDMVWRRAVVNCSGTAEELVASKPVLELGRGSVLGVVSDELHHRYGRPALLARKVFGRRVGIVPIAFDGPPATPAGIREEAGNTAFTRAMMLLVRSGLDGNSEQVIRRHRDLTRINEMFARLQLRSTNPPENRAE